MLRPASQLIFTSLLTLLILAFVAATIYWSDPYGLHQETGSIGWSHKPKKSVAVLIRNLDYDSVILGTSMSQNFRCTLFDQLFHCQSAKFTLNNTTPNQTAYLWKHIQQRQNLKYVLIDLTPDMVIWERPIDFDDVLFQIGELPWADYFSFDELKLALISEYKNIKQKKLSAVSRDDWNAWCLIYSCGLPELARNFKKAELGYHNSRDTAQFNKIFNTNYAPLIDANKSTQVFFFFPPFSILRYTKENIDEYLALKKNIIKVLLKYKNVSCFDFQFDATMVNLNNYMDAGHYSREISDWILHQIASGNYQVTIDNCDEYLSNLRELVIGYDYETAYAELEKIKQKQ